MRDRYFHIIPNKQFSKKGQHIEVGQCDHQGGHFALSDTITLTLVENPIILALPKIKLPTFVVK